MAEQDAAEKTEPATPRRREEARKRGEVAMSRDVGSLFVLAAALAIAASGLFAGLARVLAATASASWGGTALRPGGLADFHALLVQNGVALGWAALPLAGLLLVAALLGPLLQVGPMFSTQALAPRFSRIDPIKGAKRLVSPERLFDLAKSLAKLGLITTAAFLAFLPGAALIGNLFGESPALLLPVLEWQGLRVAGAALAVLALVAAVDVVWVRWRHEQRLKMSKREVRDELREREGSPEQRARLRALQRDRSRLRMLAEVGQADVVVRNPTHFAVALRYARGEMAAPTVVAKGRNQVALRILEEARRHDVPIVENPPVARLLWRTAKLGREIPEALYEAVAEILAYVYRVDKRRGAGWVGAS